METTRPRRSSGARPTDDALLDAALDVFVTDGFHAASMSRIADRADSTKPTLYAHFGGKESLYARLLEREAARARTHLFEAYERAAALGLREQTAADVEALFAYVESHPAAFDLLFGHLNSATAALVRERLLAEVSQHLAQRLTDYRSSTAGTAPTWVERQVAAMLVASSIASAQHAKASAAPDLGRACALATRYAVAALENLDPTAR